MYRRTVTGDDRESTQWKIYGERLVDENPFIRLSIASVGLPDGTDFEQYVMRMRRTATTVVVDDHLMARMGHDSERAAIIYQHEAQGADLVITSAIDAHIEALKATQSEQRDGSRECQLRSGMAR